jgi:ribonuclease III
MSMLRFLSRIFGKTPAKSESALSAHSRSRLQQKLGYSFRQEDLLVRALTHRSHLRTNDAQSNNSNERLEFLGDSALGLIVAEELFQKYPDMTEGDLTKSKSLLVNKKVLAHVGIELGLGDYILMSVDEERAGGRRRQSIVADCLEAVIGAIYLDGGMKITRGVVKRVISFDFSQTSQTLSLRNYKGELLERLQASGAGMPHYTVSGENGPEHRKTFTVDVLVGGKKMGTGEGDSKKSAEQKAAEQALEKLDSQ